MPGLQNNKDYFDQSLDEIKLLKYVNAHDPADTAGIVRLYDFFYYKVRTLVMSAAQLPAFCDVAATRVHSKLMTIVINQLAALSMRA